MTSAWRPAGLVARREITTRLRSKAFRISTLVLLGLLVGLSVMLRFVGGSPAHPVGFTSQNASLAGPFAAVATTSGTPVQTSAVPDQATGERQVRAGTLDALVVGPPGSIQVVVHKSLDEGLRAALARQQTLDVQIGRLGGDPAQVGAAAGVTVAALEPTPQLDAQRITLGIVTGALIYLSLQAWGQFVAQGVVEEKSSRVVELLLSTVAPWQLIAGKVAGIGLVGLLQIVIVAAGGAIAGLATGVLTISASAVTGTVVWLLVWYVLGFFSYALVLAAASALVSRQEEIAGVVTPILLLLVVPYALGVSILPAQPDSSLIEVLSLIPLFAPILMPMRLTFGGGAGLAGRPGGGADPSPGVAVRPDLPQRRAANRRPRPVTRRPAQRLTDRSHVGELS
ncbi:MAG: ABC transporter permease [Pseudonocardiaceae bacterium]